MWADTFVAVPVLGLQTAPSFNALFNAAERLQPILDETISRDKQLEFGAGPGLGGFHFRTQRGFTYKVLVDNLVVEFAYRSKESQAPGRLPISEMPALQTFSVLVNQTVDEMARVLGLLSAPESPKVIRFGLMVNARMEKSNAPPGITDMIKHHGSFFSGEVIKSQSTFLANIERNPKYTDRCHHTYVFDDTDKPNDLAVTLDWQRVFAEPFRFSAAVSEQLRQLKDAALAYFERVGQGGLKDA